MLISNKLHSFRNFVSTNKLKKYSEILDIACARLYLCKRDPEHNTKVNINQI